MSSDTERREPPQTRRPVLTRVRQRMPLHAITVAGGLCSAWILSHALPARGAQVGLPDLLRYVPIIIGLGANVGVQSSTVLVRAFATGELARGTERQVATGEVLVGLLTGLICGATTAAVAWLVEGRDHAALVLGLSVGAAVVAGLTWAALVGCAVPLGCRRLRVDPAIAAGPFLIMLSDVGSAGLFMLVAALVRSVLQGSGA